MSLNNIYDAKAGEARPADRRAEENAQGRRSEEDFVGDRAEENAQSRRPEEDMSCRPAPVIGLTGGIGTGKSTAAEYLADDGIRFAHVDADAISRQITEKKPGVRNPVLEEIGRAFGSANRDSEDVHDTNAANHDSEDTSDADATNRDSEKIVGVDTAYMDAMRHPPVLREDGSLDRKVMADIVFHDPAKKELLEGIMFREIIAEIHRQIDAAKAAGRPVLLDVPLLFESGLDSLCDKVIVLTANEDVRVQRVTQRDGCSAEDVLARIRNQMSEGEKLARADFVVDNSGTPEDMIRQLDDILSGIHFSPETPA